MHYSDPRLRFATIRLRTGPQLHYAEQGDPTGEAIIFLHGYSDSWFSFSRVVRMVSLAIAANLTTLSSLISVVGSKYVKREQT